MLSEREAKIRASADPVKEALEMQRAGAKRLRRWKEEILPNWAKHWTTGSVRREGGLTTSSNFNIMTMWIDRQRFRSVL